jgi:hypothetical protein
LGYSPWSAERFEEGRQMRAPVFTVFLVVFLLAATAGTAAGPPVVNSTTRFVDEPFGGIGLNCGTGNLAESDGHFSGVIKTVVKADGTVHVTANTRGTDALDDLPTDGIIDATTAFVFNSTDIVFATGNEVHHFTGTGTLTLTATDVKLHFQLVIQVALDKDGNAKLDLLHFVCD